MWVVKGTLTGVLFFITGFIAYVLSVAFARFPSAGTGNYDIRGFIHEAPASVVWLGFVGSIVVCCAVFKFLPQLLRNK